MVLPPRKREKVEVLLQDKEKLPDVVRTDKNQDQAVV
jgi:hypothetical protein